MEHLLHPFKIPKTLTLKEKWTIILKLTQVKRVDLSVINVVFANNYVKA